MMTKILSERDRQMIQVGMLAVTDFGSVVEARRPENFKTYWQQVRAFLEAPNLYQTLIQIGDIAKHANIKDNVIEGYGNERRSEKSTTGASVNRAEQFQTKYPALVYRK